MIVKMVVVVVVMLLMVVKMIMVADGCDGDNDGVVMNMIMVIR